jgi:hypothetical protein
MDTDALGAEKGVEAEVGRGEFLGALSAWAKA